MRGALKTSQWLIPIVSHSSSSSSSCSPSSREAAALESTPEHPSTLLNHFASSPGAGPSSVWNMLYFLRMSHLLTTSFQLMSFPQTKPQKAFDLGASQLHAKMQSSGGTATAGPVQASFQGRVNTLSWSLYQGVSKLGNSPRSVPLRDHIWCLVTVPHPHSLEYND